MKLMTCRPAAPERRQITASLPDGVLLAWASSVTVCDIDAGRRLRQVRWGSSPLWNIRNRIVSLSTIVFAGLFDSCGDERVGGRGE